MRGRLQLSETDKVIWAEPAIVAEVKHDTYLLMKEPWLPRECYEKDKESSTKEYSVFKFRSGFGTIFKANHQLIQSNYKLPKGTRVLIRQFEQTDPSGKIAQKILNPVAVEVAVFKENEADKQNNMPENGRGVTVSKKGFLFAEDLDLESKKGEYFRLITDDIFPNGIANISDVRQTVLGDCFLLSAISCILAAENGVAFFKDHMIQGEKYTIIKAYHPITKEPVFLKVENSLFCEEEDDTVAHKGLFIHLWEKMYAGFAFEADGKNEVKYTHPSFRVIYGEGGHAHLAFRILTGKDATEYPIHIKGAESIHPWSENDISVAEAQYQVISSVTEQSDIEMLKKKYTDIFNKLSKSTQECFVTLDNFLKWGQFLCSLKQNHYQEYEVLLALIKKMDKLQGRMTYLQALELPKLLKSLKATTELFQLFEKFILNPISSDNDNAMPLYRYTGVAEDGIYTSQQLDLFAELKQKIASNHLITASTLSKFNREVPGLRNRHAYALLDVKELSIDGKQHYFIQLKNPWGFVGRAYSWGQKESHHFISEQHAYGTFWLDLSEFTLYFKTYTVCDPVPGLNLTHTFVHSDREDHNKVALNRN